MSYSFKDGRVWLQTKKFQPFQLLLPYGLTGVTDPAGGLTAVREPSASARRRSVVADILRGEPALGEFQLETRLSQTYNYMMGLGNCTVNVQAHLGACGRPDDYYSSQIGFHWQRAHRGDLAVDRLAIIEGDDAPVAATVPFSAEIGPVVVDFTEEFLSARSIAETEDMTGIAFLGSECMEDCRSIAGAGEVGYAGTDPKAGSPLNVANVWYTTDYGETWTECSGRPFAAAEGMVGPVLNGSKNNHRVIVARSTTDPSNPAEIAYADVTTPGTTTWVLVNVGAINGQYIKAIYWLDYTRLYVTTDDGYVYKSGDGGATWSAVLSTAVQELNDIAALSYGKYAGDVWTVGGSNTVYHSADFGSTWTAVTGPAAGVDVNTVCVTPDGTVFIGYANGAIYGSYDAGASWTSLPAQGVTATGVAALRAWGDFIIWAAVNTASGGRVLRSVDGGASFRLWSLNLPANGGLNALSVIDQNIVWAVGDTYGGTGFLTRTSTQVFGV